MTCALCLAEITKSSQLPAVRSVKLELVKVPQKAGNEGGGGGGGGAAGERRRNRGFGFIEFERHEDSLAALRFSNNNPHFWYAFE